MQKLFLIVGKSGAGKDTLANFISKKLGWVQVPSYCDAPPRTDQKQGREHTFLTKDEFDSILENEHVLAYTEINGKRYCATIELLQKLPSEKPFIYIIDPAGVKCIEEQFADKFDIRICTIHATEATRASRMLGTRYGFNFKERFKNEADAFDEFFNKHYAHFTVYNNHNDPTAFEKLLKEIRDTWQH